MNRLRRFTGGERAVHHVTGVLVLVCMGTAACLYLPVLSTAVGRRDLLRTVHVWTGFALPIPVLLGLLSRAFRSDVRRLNRFIPADWEWLRRSDRRVTIDGAGAVEIGKFNPGQKLNAAFTAGAVLVMLGTGAIMTFPGPFPVPWRTGATFVHDWLFVAMAVVFFGHLWFALRDREALRGMADGTVTAEWAARHHSGWHREVIKQLPDVRY